MLGSYENPPLGFGDTTGSPRGVSCLLLVAAQHEKPRGKPVVTNLGVLY
jgi:hypothetical protein